MKIKKVGVVGCGVMGAGIAQACAQSGYQVVVSEINEQLLRKGLASISSFLDKGIEKGKITQQQKEFTLAHIKGTTSTQDFSDGDLIIEVVTENMDIKKKIFAELDKICPKHTILASNTSSLSVTEIAMTTSRPDRVLGLHFFHPVPVMKLLEMVKAIPTSDETIKAGQEFGKSLGKTIIVANDTAGFIVNRLLIPYLLNAIRMLESGVATKEDIDTGANLGLGYPVGPLKVADLSGLDTILYVANILYEEFKEPEYVAPPLLKRMVAAGWLGQKTGKGFYDYKQ